MRFLTRTRLGLALVTLATAAAAAVPAAAAAAVQASPVVGHVYVNDNTAGTNTIGAFDRHADGTLTPEAGSPFTAGGAGTGAGLASQGALQISANGRFLIAVNAGSNQISVLRIKPGGALSLVPGGVVSSRGALPVSVTVHRDLVYVANAGSGSSNYTGFRLGRGGRLTPIAGSTVALPDAAQPGDVLFNGTGSKLVGTRVGTSQIDSFTVGPRGRLTAAPESRSWPRAWVPSAASSARRLRTSCSCPTRTTPGPAPSRPSATARTGACRRSAPPRSPTCRPPRAGWRSPTTASSCSRSIPGRQHLPLLHRSRRQATAARQHPDPRQRPWRG